MTTQSVQRCLLTSGLTTVRGWLITMMSGEVISRCTSSGPSYGREKLIENNNKCTKKYYYQSNTYTHNKMIFNRNLSVFVSDFRAVLVLQFIWIFQEELEMMCWVVGKQAIVVHSLWRSWMSCVVLFPCQLVCMAENDPELRVNDI